ncbi:MAG: SWIM zinc finger family protein [Anaerolineales bacterium]|nr:SWIM zinc finger family protein [Anaerolineales bacterium]
MKTIPHLTEADIRPLATDQSWKRGEDYYYSNYVENVLWRDGLLTAEVEGSEYEPYIVQVKFDEKKISSTDCTCPYDWGGDCKHIIAALLYLCRRRDDIEQRPAIADLIANLNRDQLADIIVDLSSSHPAIIEDIERYIPLVKPGESAFSTTALSQIDTNLLRRQIKAELRTSIKSGYDYWGEEAFYDSDLGAALDPAIAQAQASLDRGEPRNALTILEVATLAWEDGIDSLDEYVRDSFEDVAEEFTTELGRMWAEALLMADLSTEEQQHWQDKLDELAETIFGGSSLEIAATAAEHGWIYPPLVSAMQGNITEKGAWEDEAPYFADELAQIRLRILAQRGSFKEYLNLAQAEGQFMLYLHMLVKQGQSDKAIAEAMQYLGAPDNIHALARTLADNNEIEKAFQLAQHGLALDESRGKAALAEWLRDQATNHQQPDLALTAAWRALTESVTLENYQALQQVSGDTWETLRAEALEITAQGKSADHKVDIYLYEKMCKQAIAVVDQAVWFSNIDKVIEAVKTDYPEWAFQQCQKRAEAIMDGGKAKNYHVAAEWLLRGREILLSAGKNGMWDTDLDQVMDKHQRKYKLMPMLRELSDS